MKWKFWVKDKIQTNSDGQQVINIVPMTREDLKKKVILNIESDLRSTGINAKNGQLTENSFIPFPISRSKYSEQPVLEQMQSMLQLPEFISYSDYNYMFNRNPIAYAICTIYPEVCWTPKPVIVELDNETGVPTTPFEIACAEIAQKLSLYEYFQRLDICAQKGQYSVMYIDYNDDDKDQNPAPADAKPKIKKGMINPETLDEYSDPPYYMSGLGKVNWESLKGKGKDAINYLVVYEQPNAWPTQYVVNNSNPSYSLISYYNLQSGGQVFGGGAQATNIIFGASLPVTWNVVHASRCLHCCERNTYSNILGIPALSMGFNDLITEMRVSYGFGMVYQLNSRGGLVFSIDQKENQSMSEEDAKKLQVQINNYTSNYIRTLLADGLKVQPINFDVKSIEKEVNVYFQKIAAGMRIPLRVLFGNEAGHLASDQDMKMFKDRKDTRQEGWCTNQIRGFFDPLIQNEVIPEPKSGGYKAYFPTVDDSDDVSNSQVFNNTMLAVSAVSSSPSTEVEEAIPAILNRALEITKVKKDDIKMMPSKQSYSRPDLRVDDLEEVSKESDIQTY